MSTERALRVSQSIKKELADMLRRDLKDPRLSGLISFTEVETTSDLRNVKVFVSVFGTAAAAASGAAAASAAGATAGASATTVTVSGDDAYEAEMFAASSHKQKLAPAGSSEMSREEKATQGVLACLNEESGYIRGELCRRLRLRFAPELVFLPDMSLERGSKVSEILAKISRGEV